MIKRFTGILLAVIMAVSVFPCILQAEETYLLRDVNDGASTEVAMSKYKTYVTEHFQIFYDTDGANSSKVTAAFLATCESVLENCWDLFIDKMGMEPPTTSVLPNGNHTTQYKTNVVLMGTGVDHYYLDADGWGAYGAVDTAGYPYFMCCIAAMSSPTTVAHEFGHTVHYAQGDNAWENNIYLGPWFEPVANWFAEQYRYEYIPNTTSLSHLYLRANHLTKMNGRAYYEAWPILQYLTEDPDKTGVYGETFVQKLLSYDSGSTSTLFWEVLEACNGNLTVADTVGNFASHMATMDFENKALYNKQIEDLYNARVFYPQQRYTLLEKFGDVENTYSVPIDRAPQAMGYNIIPIEARGTKVEVTVNPLTNVKGADWRARLVKESADGTTSYSELFSAGNKMTIEVAETDEVYLTVSATPEISTMARHTIGGWATHSTETNYPYEDKTQYPYSVTIVNGVPKKVDYSYDTMRKHKNGGGMVAVTAKVADTAYVGENAMVIGYAQVSDNAVIDGNAIVGGNAKISDNAYVGDNVIIFDRVEVSGNARVIENACLYVDYKVSGNAVVKGSALGLYNGEAVDEAVVYGDFFEDQGYKLAGGSFSGYHSLSPDSGYVILEKDGKKLRPYASGLRTRYEFSSDMRDTVAYTDLYGVNNPGIGEEYASLTGEEYFVLDASTLYYDDVKFAVRAKGEGEIFSLGDGAITLSLTPEEAVLTVDGKEARLKSKDDWCEIEVLFEDGKVKLSLNGNEQELTAETTPLRVAWGKSHYIGKGFKGEIDYLRIFDAACEPLAVASIDDGYISSFEGDVTESGSINTKTNLEASSWYGWSSTSSSVTVDGGLNITGNSSVTISAKDIETEKFVIEFKPEGGKAYPDHGILDVDGRVLFAHRFASDADALYVGRGETNASVRGSASVTDTASQARLSNFVCEKLCSGSSRSDRGALVYTDYNKVRIVCENLIWTEEMAETFQSSENKSSNLAKMQSGEKVYRVTYLAVDDGVEIPVSVSIYKGSFTGFGGFKTAGGSSGVTVSYKDLKVYSDVQEDILVVSENGVLESVIITDTKALGDNAVIIIAEYNGAELVNVSLVKAENGKTEINKKLTADKTKVMVWDGINPVRKVTEIKGN